MDLTCLKMAVPFSAKPNFHSHFQMKNLLDSIAAVKIAEVSVIEGRIFSLPSSILTVKKV